MAKSPPIAVSSVHQIRIPELAIVPLPWGEMHVTEDTVRPYVNEAWGSDPDPLFILHGETRTHTAAS